MSVSRGLLTSFFINSYMKDGLHAQNKMNSLARSNASLSGYGGTVPPGQVPNGAKDDLYDRLRRHAYQGKKSGLCTDHFLTLQYLIILCVI